MTDRDAADTADLSDLIPCLYALVGLQVGLDTLLALTCTAVEPDAVAIGAQSDLITVPDLALAATEEDLPNLAPVAAAAQAAHAKNGADVASLFQKPAFNSYIRPTARQPVAEPAAVS